MRVRATLKLTVPLILLGFAAILSTVNLLYHVPQAERAAEEDSRKRLAQEMSRLQSTLEYLLLKGRGGFARDERVGLEWLAKAASHGNVAAKEELAKRGG